jgi:hypothetical protein
MAREFESGGRRGRTVRNLKGVKLDMKVDSSSLASSFKLLGKFKFQVQSCR